MAHLVTQKTERIEIRVTPEQKEFFARAANIIGTSMSEFATSVLQQEASRINVEEELIKLTQEDRKFLANLLMNPPEPNAELKQAMKDYQSWQESRA